MFLWLFGAASLISAALIALAATRGAQPALSYVNGMLFYLMLAAAFASWAIAAWRTGDATMHRISRGGLTRLGLVLFVFAIILNLVLLAIAR